MEEQDRGATILEQLEVEGPIRSALRYLAEKLYDPDLTPSAVASRAGLDLWQFCRKFKALTGMTCTEFIAERRMREARKLLAREDLLVKEVAYRVGFDDSNYFSRRFKRVVGKSPTSYRKGGHPPGRGD